MKRMMAIFAHPDDEGAVGGTLAMYAANDTEVILVCATRGEVGQISDPSLATRESLGAVRQEELETACRILGIQHLEFLDYRDSGMKDTPQNEDPRALVQAEPQEVIGRIVGLVRRFRPDIVITFEPFGWYGHPDHVAVSRLATEALAVVGNKDANPESLPVWQPQGFYYAVIPFSKFRLIIQAARDAGIIGESNMEAAIPEEDLLETETMVTHIVDVSPIFERKQKAMAAHRTQFSEEHMFRKLPSDVMVEALGSEYFIQVYPEPADGLKESPVGDLFSLNGSGS